MASSDGVIATLVHSGRTEQVFSRYLVGADGGHGFVRSELGVGFEGETWKAERMPIADVRVDGLDGEHWRSWPKHEAGWLALCPLPSTDSFQFQAQIPADEPDDPTLERLQQIVNERTGRSDIRLRDATWLSLYRPNVRMVERYRVDRVFLAGDAAHVNSPAGGQGMNTGIQDAYKLGWKLGQVLAGARDPLLDTYEEERLPRCRVDTRHHEETSLPSPQEIRASNAGDLSPCNPESITEAAHSHAKRTIPQRTFTQEIALPTRPVATPQEHRPGCLMLFGGLISHSWPSARATQAWLRR
jgi:2-polyprenyl-6-methoxyphenol hydroxylase-like FAD-dependent oxidoreductase